MEDTKGFIEELIPQMDSPEKVYKLFHGLKYNILDTSFKGKEAWDLLHQEKCEEKGDTQSCARSARTPWLALPKESGKVKIEQHLFGWRLYSGKKFIECDSEEEARYLKVFLEARMVKVKMPKDIESLRSILPEIESLKTKITEVINSNLGSIVDTKTKAKIGHQLWVEVMK